MAIEATGCKYTRNTNLIIVLALIVVGGWFFYDGHYNQKFINDNTNVKKTDTGEEIKTPKLSLQVNRIWGPIACGLGAIYFLAQALALGKKLITADDSNITVKGGPTIPYTSITKIDKRDFEKKGILKIYHDADGAEKELRLSDRTYDNLGLLLDEIVVKTGAAPENGTKDDQA